MILAAVMLLAMKTLIDVIRLPLTLKITTARVVETNVIEKLSATIFRHWTG